MRRSWRSTRSSTALIDALLDGAAQDVSEHIGGRCRRQPVLPDLQPLQPAEECREIHAEHDDHSAASVIVIAASFV